MTYCSSLNGIGPPRRQLQVMVSYLSFLVILNVGIMYTSVEKNYVLANFSRLLYLKIRIPVEKTCLYSINWKIV